MKKVLITSGGTREYIDDVRVLTNISSGKLGAMIAEKFANYYNPHENYHNMPINFEYEVHYVYAKGSILPLTTFIPHNPVAILHEVTDVASLMKVMEELVPQMDIVIHSMAVSDFGFRPIATKLKSSDTDAFIDSMRERIFKNPKVLSHIREWNPNCFLISFKFEVGLTKEELYKIAGQSMMFNKCDVVVANDKTEMVANKSHIAHILEYKEPIDLKTVEEITGEKVLGTGAFFVQTTVVKNKEEIVEELFRICNNGN